MLYFRCTNFHRQKISIARSDVKHAFESQFRKQRAFGVERNFSNIFEKCLEKAKQAEQLLPANSSRIHTKIPFSVLFFSSEATGNRKPSCGASGNLKGYKNNVSLFVLSYNGVRLKVFFIQGEK